MRSWILRPSATWLGTAIYRLLVLLRLDGAKSADAANRASPALAPGRATDAPSKTEWLGPRGGNPVAPARLQRLRAWEPLPLSPASGRLPTKPLPRQDSAAPMSSFDSGQEHKDTRLCSAGPVPACSSHARDRDAADMETLYTAWLAPTARQPCGPTATRSFSSAARLTHAAPTHSAAARAARRPAAQAKLTVARIPGN